MSLKIHALVQDANDEHALFVWDVKDHVGLVPEAPQSWGKFIGSVAIQRFVSKSLKSKLQVRPCSNGLARFRRFRLV